MDITNFVVQGRDKALLYGDYSTYHDQLNKRLLSSRKKLGISTKKNGKFQKKDPASGEEISQNHEYVHLSLLTSERAWAHAMSMKAAHVAKSKGIKGRTRSHVVSRLDKAAKNAELLVETLSDKSSSGASSTDVLEVKAYAAMIRATALFENQRWDSSLKSYAVARIIYSALASAAKGDIYKDLLSETIDPAIRYSAYQLKTPRTIPIPIIARKAFPESDKALVEDINKIDSNILKQDDQDSTSGIPGVESAPQTLTWRSREVKIEDASIAVAWGSVQGAKSRLSERLADTSDMSLNEVAIAYDELLMATQDAVDATKQAIDELKAEGVGSSDSRMQSLQITRTAVNYEMISWQVGRNRVLTGADDGAPEVYNTPRRGRKAKSTTEEGETPKQPTELPTGRKLAKLKEKAALYDGTLQNLDSIKELPGVAADEKLASKIDAFTKYFQALMALAIARSHAIVGHVTNALALINHSFELSQQAAAELSQAEVNTNGPLSVDVSHEALEFLTNLLNGELQRHRAIVHIDQLRKLNETEIPSAAQVPLVERLHEYPAGGVDLQNIVQFPPKMALIPLKPIFLDVAWNYIQYPGKEPQSATSTKASAPAPAVSASEAKEEDKTPAKRGWFGFGRS